MAHQVHRYLVFSSWSVPKGCVCVVVVVVVVVVVDLDIENTIENNQNNNVAELNWGPALLRFG